jgi:DNA-binding transcriptional LysR family regulator
MSHSDLLSTRQLEVFVALVEQGSFTKAARHLGLSQSTVSGHVADLEGRLGIRVVGRERSGVTPTAAGRTLLKPARDALRAERNVRMAAAQMSGLLQGTLAVGGSTISAVYLLPPLLSAFRGEHEGISINLVTGDSAEILDKVHQGDVDIGVVGVTPDLRGLVSEPIARDELVLIVPAGHPLDGQGPISASQAAEQQFVMREEGSGTRQKLLDAFGTHAAGTELEVVCQVGSTEAVKAAVRAGLGVSFVSDLAVSEEVAAGSLVVVDVEDLRLTRAFHLVAREAEHLSPAGRAFWNEALAGQPALRM